MRTLLVASVSVAVLACASAPEPSAASTTCETTRSAVIVAGFNPVTPVDYAVWRHEIFYGSASSNSRLSIYEESGTPTPTARERVDRLRFCDDTKCPPPGDAASTYRWTSEGRWGYACSGSSRVGGAGPPGYEIDQLVVARGDDVQMFTTHDELVAFFGPIDTKDEAVFLASRDGFAAGCKYGSIAEVADGFVLEMPTHECALAPGGKWPEWITLEVARDGHTKILARRSLR